MKARPWRSIIALAGCVLALGCGGGGGSGGGGSSAGVALVPAEAKVAVGATVAVDVEGINLAGVHAVAFDVLYDADRLEFVGASPGGLLGQAGVEAAFAAALQDGAPGRLAIGAARLGSVSGSSGSGSLARLQFRAIGSGAADLAFGDPKTASGPANESQSIGSWTGTTISAE